VDRYVAGIGRRELTALQQAFISDMATRIVQANITLTSGNAIGCDQAFAKGARVHGTVELYLPWANYERAKMPVGQQYWTANQATPAHIEAAKNAHSAWDHLGQGVRRLMIRNAMIVMRFDKPVSCVYAFPSYHKPGWSGTGHAMRVAASLGIPVWLMDRNCYWDPIDGQPTEEETIWNPINGT